MGSIFLKEIKKIQLVDNKQMFMEKAQKHSFVVFKVYPNLKTDDDCTVFEQFIPRNKSRGSFVGRDGSRADLEFNHRVGRAMRPVRVSGPYRTGVWCEWIEDQ